MTLNEFMIAVKVSFPVGTVIDNPGGGTSTISGYSETKISYIRGESRIFVQFSDLYEAYSYFKGKRVSSADLRAFRPSVFDSGAIPAGHSCNCTFLFRVLEKLNLSGQITGSGVRGNPFAVTVSREIPVNSIIENSEFEISIEKIANSCKQHLDLKNAKLSEEYYYNSLPLCVIDAVYSLGIRYTITRNVVKYFCNKVKIDRLRRYGEPYPSIEKQFSIEALLNLYDQFGAQEIAVNFFNSRNRTSPKHGILKSEAVFYFASVLKKYGVNYFQDMQLIIGNEKFEYDVKEIPGQGSGLSLSYFYMLSGEENFIKADRMMIRFIESAIQGKVTKEESLSLIAGAHDILKADFPNLTIRMLDHEIWKFQRQSSNPVSISSNSIKKAESIEKSERLPAGVPKYARILRDRVNRVIVQVPGRSFPGVVLQGDQLFQLVEMAKHSSNQTLYKVLLNLYNDLSNVPDKTTKIQVTEILKGKFKEIGRVVSIPKQKGGSFSVELAEDGVNVDNLGSQPFLPWVVFEEAVWVMRLNGGRAQFGKAMSARLGEPDLPYDSIEGHIASQVYGKRHGDSVFRRIVPISNILIWSGICKTVTGELILTETIDPEMNK